MKYILISLLFLSSCKGREVTTATPELKLYRIIYSGAHGNLGIITSDDTILAKPLTNEEAERWIHAKRPELSEIKILDNGLKPVELKPFPSPIPDTSRPSYEYFFHIRIPTNRFSQPLDTIDMVMQRMGKSMTVDQADEMRAIVAKQLTNFIGRPVLDSVLIKDFQGKPVR